MTSPCSTQDRIYLLQAHLQQLQTKMALVMNKRPDINHVNEIPALHRQICETRRILRKLEAEGERDRFVDRSNPCGMHSLAPSVLVPNTLVVSTIPNLERLPAKPQLGNCRPTFENQRHKLIFADKKLDELPRFITYPAISVDPPSSGHHRHISRNLVSRSIYTTFTIDTDCVSFLFFHRHAAFFSRS